MSKFFMRLEVLNWDNPKPKYPKYRHLHFTPKGELIPSLPLSYRRPDYAAIFDKDTDDTKFFEKCGWEKVYYRNRKAPGAKIIALQYTAQLRSLAGATAMMSSALMKAGFTQYAKEVQYMGKHVKQQLKNNFEIERAKNRVKKQEKNND